MKVLHVSTYADEGGAARAAYRLHTALRRIGVDSWMEVQEAHDRYPYVMGPQTRWQKLAAQIRPRLTRPLLRLQRSGNPIFHSVNLLPSGRVRRINQSDVDVVHLHWVNKEMLSIAEIGRIAHPVVWTLHDGWAFCGAEHHSRLGGQARYRDGYASDNRDDDHRGVDIDRWVWRRKMKHFSKARFTVVTPSRWLGACAADSQIFREHRVEVIPNGIDLQLYKPIEPAQARSILGLPPDQPLVLFGALHSTHLDLKGYSLLTEALTHLPGYATDDVELVVFGASDGPQTVGPYRARYVGTLRDEFSLVLAYSAADVFVAPSKQDNLPNTVMEALACGTPCVAFDIGGMPDLIDHGENGYLAEAFDPHDLARGIGWVLQDEARRQGLSMASRRKVEQSFDDRHVAERYRHLYRDVVASGPARRTGRGPA